MKGSTEAAEIRRRGGTRATMILGCASILAGFGAVLGGVTMIAIDGDSFPDYSQYSVTGTIAGAGIGWVLGAFAGAGLSRGGRAVGRAVALLLWAAAATVIAIGVALWSFWETFLVTTTLIEGELHAMRIATSVGAAAVAVTLVVASWARTRDADERPPGPVARVLATVGLVTVTTLFGGILVATYDSQRQRLETRTGRAVDTAQRLLANAHTFHAVHGHFPATREELMDGAGISQANDVAVVRFGEAADGYCVTVALLGGERGTRADELFVTGVVPPGTGSTPVVAEGEVPCDDVAANATTRAGPSATPA